MSNLMLTFLKQQNYQNPSCQVSGNHATIDIATRLAERSLLQWRYPQGV